MIRKRPALVRQLPHQSLQADTADRAESVDQVARHLLNLLAFPWIESSSLVLRSPRQPDLIWQLLSIPSGGERVKGPVQRGG